MKQKLLESFSEIFENRNDTPVLFFSPGRVNLVGEHTDYNKGFVFPCALNFGTYLAALPNSTGQLRLRSLNFSFTLDTSTDGYSRNSDGEWVNYPLGVIDRFRLKGIGVPGLDLLYYGDIPNGAGLSSSASIEMVTAVALNHFTSAGLDMWEMVKMSQKAENEFVGMNCGIMDQFAVGFGEKERALFLNCDTLEYRSVPLELGEYRIVITNTNKRRGLTDSKYNERRSECETAVARFNAVRPAEHLSMLSADDLGQLEETLNDPVIFRRARHVIMENNRVLEAVKLLHQGNLAGFGRVMNESHDSLRDDYEVTGFELDTLVEQSRKVKGVLGSRMTGAGFGGCTVSLVHRDAIDQFREKVADGYTRATGLIPDFYLPEIGRGATILV